MRGALFILSFSLLSLLVAAQDSVSINALLKRIALQQATRDNGFTKNNFPSYISNTPHFKTQQRDDNIFFAALIHYTLRQSAPVLSQNERSAIDSIKNFSSGLYPHFKNNAGRVSYNFWRTDTPFVFPYTRWIRRFKRNTSLPDDLDDTALSLMAQITDSATAAAAHRLMQSFINRSNKAKTIEKGYQGYKTYSVWFGKNFPPVLDVCVLCNVLSMVQQYHLSWTAADSASLSVIVHSIKTADFINKPLAVSPYYGNPSLLLYHFARLMSYGNISQLEELKPLLVATAAQRLHDADDPLEKIILASSIMKWGYVAPDLEISPQTFTISKIEKSNFPFFTGNIPSYFPPFWRHLFYQKKWLLFYHYCPAYNDALLVEYLSLRQTLQSAP